VVLQSVFIGSCYFTGSTARIDEDKLLEHLFQNRSHNLMTIPITNNNESLSVLVGIGLQRLIALVLYTLSISAHNFLLRLSVICKYFRTILLILFQFWSGTVLEKSIGGGAMPIQTEAPKTPSSERRMRENRRGGVW